MNKRLLFKRFLWKILGSLALMLAILGVVLPGLPTTPFLLLSAYCFRDSARFQAWLQRQPRLYQALQNWQKQRRIPFYGKAAMLLMSGVSCALLFWKSAFWLAASLTLLVVAVAFFLCWRY